MFGRTETFNDLYNHVNFDYRNETNLYGDMRWSDRVIENGLWEKNIYNFITKVYPKVVSEFEIPFQMKDSLQRIDESKLHIAPRIENQDDQFTKVVLFSKMPFDITTKEDRIRTCYMLSCLY